MTEAKKLKLIRVLAVVILLSVTLTAALAVYGARIRAIDRRSPALRYLYSDSEMEPVKIPQDNETDIFVKLGQFDKKYDIDVGFVEFCSSDERINPSGVFLQSFKTRLDLGRYDDDIWADLTGYTFSVLYDIFVGVSDDTSVIGDVFDQNKTVISFFDGESAGELSDMIAESGVRFEVGEEPKYFISGGLKFALCTAEDDIAAVKAVCDTVIVEADAEFDPVSLANAGADIVLVRSGETGVEYIGDTVAVYGLTDELYMSVTLAVGIDPIVRLYPTVLTEGGRTLCDPQAAKAVYEAINGRSDSAKIDENGRVRYK